MLILLPPSETKRDGGAEGTALALGGLGFPELKRERKVALSALRSLSRSVTASTHALGLGPQQRFEIDRNRTLSRSALLPAIDRYTGLLYDGLDAVTLSAGQRAFADRHIVIHSALFGLIRAGDPIPAYRLSHDSRMPSFSLRRHWRDSIALVLAEYEGFVLDLRSEAYVALGPAPGAARYLRVLSEDGFGRRAALSHFNKKAKGEFARAIIEARIAHGDAQSLLDWAVTAGIRLEPGAPGELALIVSSA